MQAYAPQAQLTAILDVWSDYYIERVQAVIDDAWETHTVWWGLEEGMVEMAPYGPAVTAEAAEAGDAVKDGIVAGTLHPFDGPIENQAGEVVVAEGESLTDEQMLKMDWWVKGVQA
jgi:simple sugar transport system substrate-binding protein